jgi:hypothetical protein
MPGVTKRSDPSAISSFDAAPRPHAAGGMTLDAVYRAAEASNTVIAHGDRPWSLLDDADLILIWHALNALPAPRVLELRRRLESEMRGHRGLEAEQFFADRQGRTAPMKISTPRSATPSQRTTLRARVSLRG